MGSRIPGGAFLFAPAVSGSGGVGMAEILMDVQVQGMVLGWGLALITVGFAGLVVVILAKLAR